MRPGRNSRLQVDPSLSVRWRGGAVAIRVPSAQAELEASHPAVLEVLSSFGGGATRSQARARVRHLSDTDFRRLVGALVEVKALRAPHLSRQPRWGPVELEFHTLWRERGTATKLSEVPWDKRSAVRRPTPGAPRVRLPPPAVPAARLDRLLGSRQSVREFAPAALPLESLSGILQFSSRNRWNGAGVLHRPYPSGGAACSLEVYPLLGPRAVAGIRSGVYRYRPEAHDLEFLGAHPRAVSLFLESAGGAMHILPARPPIVLAVATRFERVSRGYPDALAYSVVLREVGCLLQTIYLVGAALGVGCCALGRGLPTRFLSELTKVPWDAEALVGEIALGVPASA
jgi:SagB-type dehydrogenase family enzyme